MKEKYKGIIINEEVLKNEEVLFEMLKDSPILEIFGLNLIKRLVNLQYEYEKEIVSKFLYEVAFYFTKKVKENPDKSLSEITDDILRNDKKFTTAVIQFLGFIPPASVFNRITHLVGKVRDMENMKKEEKDALSITVAILNLITVLYKKLIANIPTLQDITPEQVLMLHRVYDIAYSSYEKAVKKVFGESPPSGGRADKNKEGGKSNEK